MALVVATLKTQLELHWLTPPGGTFPANVTLSADHFASAVASWFSLAQANGVPCTTAQARRPQLSLLAATAFSAGTADAAAQKLASALATYITGQLFGAGTAGAPARTADVEMAFRATFGDLELSNGDRAQRLAQACQDLATSTLVAFPAPAPLAKVE